MSDHMYISFSYENSNLKPRMSEKAFCKRYPRWCLKNADGELFKEVMELKAMGYREDLDVRESAKWVKEVTTEACDLAAHRWGPKPRREAAYWWNTYLDTMRATCLRTRRRLTRLRRRGDQAERERVEMEYRIAKRMLKNEIKKAKKDARQELINSISDDPWGLPYKVALGRLRPYSPRVTEAYDLGILNQMLETLFPAGETHDPAAIWEQWQEPLEEEQVVSAGEVDSAIRGKGRSGNPAPGPDGITLRIWRGVPASMRECLAKVYTKCLEQGQYPTFWKRAMLVLIPKGEPRNDVKVPKVRPICLLDDVGKIFERILVSRLKEHMNANRDAGLSPRQYGFREGRSTTDALIRVTEFVRSHMDRKN